MKAALLGVCRIAKHKGEKEHIPAGKQQRRSLKESNCGDPHRKATAQQYESSRLKWPGWAQAREGLLV
eukprot:1146957-Pelagomonas_calceolata.AAC.5